MPYTYRDVPLGEHGLTELQTSVNRKKQCRSAVSHYIYCAVSQYIAMLTLV